MEGSTLELCSMRTGVSASLPGAKDDTEDEGKYARTWVCAAYGGRVYMPAARPDSLKSIGVRARPW